MGKSLTIERFKYVFAGYIVYASIKTMVAAPQIVAEHLSAHGTLARAHLLALAGVEAVAAVGLLIRKLAAASTAVLLGVFTVAALIDASLGEVPAHLVLYAAITLLLRGEAPGGGVVSSAAPA